MKTQLHLTGDAKILDALARFLAALEAVAPEPVSQPKTVCGEDNVIYVEVGYRTDEDTFLVGDHMAQGGPRLWRRPISSWLSLLSWLSRPDKTMATQ